jgi:hypothetical protein
MDWDEVHTRVGQEVSKRLDVALYSVGFHPGKNGVDGRPDGSARFFFSTADIPGRIALLREHIPNEVEGIVREANAICKHEFRLLGYDSVCYGPEIDWHLDAVHGKRAPLKPWFKVRFLDFQEVGDHKIVWELNRHQHLVTLAKARLLTGEPKYSTELFQQWHWWQRANPYPLGINWASSLEVAFRSLSWLWMWQLLANCDDFPLGFKDELLHALALGGQHIERHLSTYYSPNTHLLGEAVALFFIGTLCPQIPGARRWRDKGWSILLDESERQVHSDGMYFEQALYYHVYALDLFMHARLLAECNHFEVPDALDKTICKMLRVLAALSQAGPPESFGDDDGGRVFNPRRNRTEHLTDPLATGAVLFPDIAPRQSTGLTEESIWLFGERAVSVLTHAEDLRQPLSSVSFRDSGVYVMASRERYAQRMVIDAGPQGTGRSGHGHADALSVSLSLDGQRWLVDSGTGCYISAGEARDSFRGTGAHNTVRVDGLDQAVPETPFAWSSIPTARTDCWRVGETFAFFAGSHDGYSRLADPVTHRRFVFQIPGEFYLVRDVVEGCDSHELEVAWHFAPGIALEKYGAGLMAQRSNSSMRLALLGASDSDWVGRIESGVVSPAYGLMEPVAVVRFSARVRLPTNHATLLVPLPTSWEKPGRFTDAFQIASDSRGPGFSYIYDGNGQKHLIIFGTPGESWSVGSWQSDAGFLSCSFESGQLKRLVVCDCSFVRASEKEVINVSQTLECLEWIEHGGVRQITSCDSSVLPSISEAALVSIECAF